MRPAGRESTPKLTPESTRIAGNPCPSETTPVKGQPVYASEGESELLARGNDRQLLTRPVIHRRGAGEGIRTPDVQLGKLAFPNCKYCLNQDLQLPCTPFPPELHPPPRHVRKCCPEKHFGARQHLVMVALPAPDVPSGGGDGAARLCLCSSGS